MWNLVRIVNLIYNPGIPTSVYKKISQVLCGKRFWRKNEITILWVIKFWSEIGIRRIGKGLGHGKPAYPWSKNESYFKLYHQEKSQKGPFFYCISLLKHLYWSLQFLVDQVGTCERHICECDKKFAEGMRKQAETFNMLFDRL